MTVSEWLITFAIVWTVAVALYWLVVAPWLRRGPANRADFGVLWRAIHVLARFIHHTTYGGLDRIPHRDENTAGIVEGKGSGLIVISNHTGSVDPLLIQGACSFWIRWLMASETMIPSLDWLWRNQNMVAVDRDGADSGPLREAIRWVRKGGAIGIFPEGRIVVPPREIRPFYTGVGFIVAKTKAPVLIVWVSGTPETTKMSESLFTSSRARIEFLGVHTFEDEKDPKAIASRLREIIHEASDWPLNDEAMPPIGEV